MNEQSTPCKCKHDPLLLPFQQAAEEGMAQQYLDNLLHEHILPLLCKIFRRKLSFSLSQTEGQGRRPDEQELDDLCGEALCQLLGQLRLCRTAPSAEPIRNLLAYVRVTADNVFNRFLQRKYPRRWRLHTSLYHLMTEPTNPSGFALWKSAERETLCGYAAWRESGHVRQQTVRYDQIGGFTHLRVTSLRTDKNLSTLVGAIFDWVERPLLFSDLVSIIADLCEVEEDPSQPGSADDEWVNPYEGVVDMRVDVASTVSDRLFLQKVWEHICQLPPLQRAALLLSMRDEQGRGVISLLPEIGVASLRRIAEALEWTAESLAALWYDLPLNDTTIAQRLGKTRQQVINMRQAARIRLARHLKREGLLVLTSLSHA